jgi:hypothetical protein
MTDHILNEQEQLNLFKVLKQLHTEYETLHRITYPNVHETWTLMIARKVIEELETRGFRF